MSLSYTEFQQVQTDLNTYRSREASLQISIIQANKERDAALATGNQAAADAAIAKSAKREELLALTREDISKAQSQIDEFNNTPTVKSESDVAREQRAQNSSLVDTTDPSAPAQTNNSAGTPQPGTRVVPGVPAGAELASKPRPNIVFNDVTGNKIGEDLRVKIRVPSKYLTAATVGMNGELEQLGGIIFPYTPSISFESKADYSPQQPLHSNFAINFYQKSSIGSISISGKFSVQNEKDAGVYIATMHLLKALTKMRSGGTLGDPDSGAPPPVCRLDGHGAMILNNVPVVITSYKIDLPDSVDYFTLPSNVTYSATSVPTISTISITCLPMYSRNEMQNFSVTGYLNDYSYRRQGYI
jgi:hypothetical protein